MQSMALRAIPKINRNVFQNSCRLFSFKFEMTPASRLPQEENNAPEEQPQSSAFRYNVCQPRTTPVERPFAAGDAHKQTVKAAIECQHLQPAMLPEYFQKQMERHALINPEPEPNEEDRINNGYSPINQRRFQVSKTYANAILPLKSVKLANPFPEPVKMMMSRTVSDDEKAEQMLAESKSQKNLTDWGKIGQNPPYRSFSTVTQRWYSKTVGPNPEKCKKMGGKGKKSCPKMTLDKCPPPARTKCDRLAKQIDCKKQEAPYPAYSEFCHEDIEEKPSSCKLCPWKPEENPNFNPQKKKFHTSSCTALKRSGLEMDQNEYRSQLSEEPAEEGEQAVEGMQCDMRKPPCERPKNRRCPPTEKEKRAKEEKERAKKKSKKDCSGAENIAEMLEEVLPELDTKPDIFSLKQGHGPCKIKKFRFPACEQRSKRQEISEQRCPKKKRKPKITDCPPMDDKGCNTAGLEVVPEFRFSSSGKSDKSKCPKIDMTVDKGSMKDQDDDPCKLKRKGTTRICPGDLLQKKRRRPRKKTSAIITPVESNKKEPPQPTTRTM